MRLARYLLAAFVAVGAAGVQAADVTDEPSYPQVERKITDPGLGASSFDDHPGPQLRPEDTLTSRVEFDEIDANQDGYISQDEAAAYPEVADLFMEADEDADGLVSAEEFSEIEITEER